MMNTFVEVPRTAVLSPSKAANAGENQVARRPPIANRQSLIALADRRRLGLVLGFLVGLAILGPIAALATALAGAALVRLFDIRTM